MATNKTNNSDESTELIRTMLIVNWDLQAYHKRTYALL